MPAWWRSSCHDSQALEQPLVMPLRREGSLCTVHGPLWSMYAGTSGLDSQAIERPLPSRVPCRSFIY